QYLYGAERGDIGRLALAVAKTADADAAARGILRGAGTELARLARALTSRFGARELALTGRASRLHPLIVEAMRDALPPETALRVRESHGHRAAARLALETNR